MGQEILAIKLLTAQHRVATRGAPMIAGRYNVAEAKAIDVKKANISFRVTLG